MVDRRALRGEEVAERILFSGTDPARRLFRGDIRPGREIQLIEGVYQALSSVVAGRAFTAYNSSVELGACILSRRNKSSPPPVLIPRGTLINGLIMTRTFAQTGLASTTSPGQSFTVLLSFTATGAPLAFLLYR